jgi:uncharacterized membrane protein YdjX (TVP38/TMEM64 family)
MPNSSTKKVNWLRLVLTVAGFAIVSIGLGYVVEKLLGDYHIAFDIPAWEALAILFGIMLVINLSLLPLPFGVSVMLVAASHWNPVLVALVGSLGASIGECSAYLFGELGKKVAISDDVPGYAMMHRWIIRYGMWAIALISFQPILPFEVGGFIAGVTKMPFKEFLPAIWIGKFPKYLILIYLGGEIIHLFG